MTNSGSERIGLVVVTLALWLGAADHAIAQGRSSQPPSAPPPPPTPKAAAPIDLTGLWVSVVTEDWRWRMLPPPKGDYQSVPITSEAKRLADGWDPAKDEAAGEQCRSYGAAAIMRVPTRLRITWQDDNTLKVETDAGTQTRLLHFAPWKPGQGKPSWQGDSVAEWEIPGARAGGAGRAAGSASGTTTPPTVTGGRAQDQQPKFGSLKVVTTNMRPGYLRKNGIPYSPKAVMTEYWDVHKELNGDQWLVVTTLIDDAMYLQQQWVTSPNFKREPDGSKWNPTPCSARW